MNKLKKIVNSVVQYFILLILIYVIQYIIEHFWQMPDYLDLLFNFIVGILAILITISEEKMKQLKMIPILRVHFESMNEVNEKIAQGAKDGTFKGSLRFLGGISYMILYSLFINTLALIIEAIIAAYNQTPFVFDFLPSFALLLGSVPCAYLKWLSVFSNDIKNLEKAKQTNDRAKIIVNKMIFSSKLWVLFISYFVWLTGEVIFLSTNAEWASYMNLFVIVALIYFVLLTAILIILRLSIKIGDAPEPNHKSKKNGESSQSSTQ